jgi:hypothetical protein
MRPAAEVDPLALLVHLERLVSRNRVDQFDLEVLAARIEEGLGLITRPDFFGKACAALDDFGHLLLDGREILFREWLVPLEVVVEAVLDHRTDGDLRRRPQLLHRLGEHVRGIVPDQLEHVLGPAIARHELDAAVVVERV